MLNLGQPLVAYLVGKKICLALISIAKVFHFSESSLVRKTVNCNRNEVYMNAYAYD